MAFRKMTATEAALYLGVSKATICRWCERGLLRCNRTSSGAVNAYEIDRQQIYRLHNRKQRGESIRNAGQGAAS